MGRAEAVTLRTESGRHVNDRLITVLSFRLQPPERPQAIEVELRGPTLTGTVRDGDWVELPDRPDRTGRYALDTVTNLTTGLPVTTQPPGRGGVLGVVFLVVFVVLALVVLGFFAFVLLDVATGFGDGYPDF